MGRFDRHITYLQSRTSTYPFYKIFSVFTRFSLFGRHFYGVLVYQIVDFYRRHNEGTVIKDGKWYQGHTSSEHSDNSFAGTPGCVFPKIFFGIILFGLDILLFLSGRTRSWRFQKSSISCSTICLVQISGVFFAIFCSYLLVHPGLCPIVFSVSSRRPDHERRTLDFLSFSG